MALYKVKAANDSGKVFVRDMEAVSEDDVHVKLEREGLYALDVRAEGMFGFLSGPVLFSGKGVKRAEFMVFTKGLIALMKAGIPVVDALDALGAGAASVTLKSAIRDVSSGVRSGMQLSEAMAKRPDVFSPLYTAALSSGERTGDMLPAMKGYIEYAARIETLRKKIVRSVSYPLILAFVSTFAIGFLMWYVVPTFSKVYEGFSGELPVASRALFAASVLVRAYWIALVIGMAAVFAGAVLYLRTPSGKRRLDSLKLGFPQFGDVYRGYAAAKFSRTLAMVFKSGLPIMHALETAKPVLSNSVLEEKLDYVIKKTREGSSVASAMEEVSFYPDITQRMFTVGEKTASLPEMLLDIADYHDEEVDHRMQIMTNMIEPALMIFMGLIIGTIVILLYLPIFQMGSRF
ncbi:MAG: type II secretion system F family protein [Deltaproteobacteria bacterium]|nr:type II secretion system F family protein [Deltaproteobacteria bacterium]